ncbi:MAG: 1,4-dihydroxy-2-naphthoate octaprenyltransferase [Calditrichia bacterium]
MADGVFHLPSAIVAFLGALLIQVGTNYANDYFDFKKVQTPNTGSANSRDSSRVGNTGIDEAGVHSNIWTGCDRDVSGFSRRIPILMIGVASILFGILYTGGPSPLGYNGTADFFVLIFFGPVAVGGTYFVQSLEINTTVLLAGLAPGFISTAILTVNNLRDVFSDRDAGKRTLVVRFGVGFGRMEYLVCLIVASCVPVILYVLYGGNVFAVMASLALLIAIPDIKTIWKISGSPVLNNVLANTGRFLFLFSLLFSIGWLI